MQGRRIRKHSMNKNESVLIMLVYPSAWWRQDRRVTEAWEKSRHVSHLTRRNNFVTLESSCNFFLFRTKFGLKNRCARVLSTSHRTVISKHSNVETAVYKVFSDCRMSSSHKTKLPDVNGWNIVLQNKGKSNKTLASIRKHELESERYEREKCAQCFPMTQARESSQDSGLARTNSKSSAEAQIGLQRHEGALHSEIGGRA